MALDAFSYFFIDPLFTESGTAREIDAVDSEFSSHLQSDVWRSDQARRWEAFVTSG